LSHGYRQEVWQLPLDGDFDGHSSQMIDVDVGVSEEKEDPQPGISVGVDLNWGPMKGRCKAVCQFTGAAWGINESEVLCVKDRTFTVLMLSNKTNK
jgi:hypothetical protein